MITWYESSQAVHRYSRVGQICLPAVCYLYRSPLTFALGDYCCDDCGAILNDYRLLLRLERATNEAVQSLARRDLPIQELASAVRRCLTNMVRPSRWRMSLRSAWYICTYHTYRSRLWGNVLIIGIRLFVLSFLQTEQQCVDGLPCNTASLCNMVALELTKAVQVRTRTNSTTQILVLSGRGGRRA